MFPHTYNLIYLLFSLESGWRNTLSSHMTVRVSSLSNPQELLRRSSLDTNLGAPRLLEFPPEWPNIFFSDTSTTKDFSLAEFRRENLKVAATGSTCLSHLKYQPYVSFYYVLVSLKENWIKILRLVFFNIWAYQHLIRCR